MTDGQPPGSPAKAPIFHRSRMEYLAFVSQIISAAAVVVSLFFVGMQLQEGNKVAARDESNATMTQWTAFRTSIYESADTARVFQSGMAGEGLSAPDKVRFLYIMREHGWATFQIWDRVQNNLVPAWNFEVGAANDYFKVICTPGGAPALAEIKSELPPPYVKDMDRLMPAYAQAHGVKCTP